MKILVCGFGKSGKAAARLAAAKGNRVYVYDDNPMVFNGFEWELLSNFGITIFNIVLDNHPDLIIVSPDFPIASPLLKSLKDIPVISEMQYAMRFCKGRSIAVSGTNGKTTVCTLLYEILSRSNKTFLLGNIGTPLSEEVENIKESDFVILETSSFQLEASSYFRPNIACLINIAPDHLDRHASMEEYIALKHRLFTDMGKGDYAILNADDPLLLVNGEPCTREIKGLLTYYISVKGAVEGCFLYKNSIFCNIDGYISEIISASELKIIGIHNVYNAMTAACAALLCGVAISIIAEGLRSFKGLPHRIEFVDTVQGVPFYNDSKGTNPHATMSAVESFINPPSYGEYTLCRQSAKNNFCDPLSLKEEKPFLNASQNYTQGNSKPLVLILGGSEKKLDFYDLILSLNKDTFCIFIGETKNSLVETAKRVDNKNYTDADSFESAVRIAFLIAKDRGAAVLLSPACASFDMFENYAHRGDSFKSLVKCLKEEFEMKEKLN